MAEHSNYWIRRLNSSRLSRRRFVGASAVAGVGAAGIALVGCGGDDDDDDSSTEPAGTAAPGETPSTSPTTAPSGPQAGGVRRSSSSNNTYDTFDVDRSRFTPFATLMGYTNLGIVHYKSFADAELEGGFARDWEQPDAQTITFKLRTGLKWHNKAPVNGREATVEDMKFFLERNKAGTLQDGTEDPNFYRKSEYASIESVEVVDAETLTVRFSQPNPFFLGTLAGAYSKIQAPEAVQRFENEYQNLSADLIIGTGAFILSEFDAAGSAKLVRNDEFHDPVYLDGIEFLPLFTDIAAQQAAFEQKQVDLFGPRSKDILEDLLSRYDGQIYDTPSFGANPIAGTYYGGAEPWSNQNLVGAIFRTVNRRLLIQQMFQGRAVLSGSIPPTQSAFTIPESELITLPGYLEDHEADIKEARAMWEAGGGPALGTITIDIPDIHEGAYSGVAASYVQMFKETLGDQFEAKIEPYSTITGKIVAQKYGNGSNNLWFGWISDVTKLEPTADLWALFNSAAPGFFQYGVKIDEVDNLTNQAVSELDIEKRKVLCKDIARQLITNYGAGVPYTTVQIVNTLRWNYMKSGEAAPFVNAHNTYRADWFDQADPTWQGRKA